MFVLQKVNYLIDPEWPPQNGIGHRGQGLGRT